MNIPHREWWRVYEWMVYQDYVVKDGHLCIAGHYHGSYNPVQQQELPGEIAKVQRGDTKALLQCARTYGMFGYFFLYRPNHDENPPLWNPGPVSLPSGPPQHIREPLAWIWAHINTLHLCLELQRHVYDQWVIEDCIERHGGRKLHDTHRYEIPIAVKGHTDVVQQSQKPQESIYDVAQRLRHEIIQRNIQDIRSELQPGDRPAQPTLSFASLIEVVYWHLAENKHKPVKECAWCGALFIVQHGKQQYCPHPQSGKESPCGASARQAKQRQKKRVSIS